MELINFAAWIEQQKVLTSTDVDTTTDQFIIGKKVNDKRDGSQYQAFAINATELAKIFAPPVSTEKVYKALLTQTGTDAPVATVLENTLGEVPTFSYLGSGAYQVTSPGGIFVQAKTVLYPITSIDVDFSHSFIWNSTTQLYINTAMLGVKSNDLLNYTLILIEVYP